MNKNSINNDETDDGYNGSILFISYTLLLKEIYNFYVNNFVL